MFSDHQLKADASKFKIKSFGLMQFLLMAFQDEWLLPPVRVFLKSWKDMIFQEYSQTAMVEIKKTRWDLIKHQLTTTQPVSTALCVPCTFQTHGLINWTRSQSQRRGVLRNVIMQTLVLLDSPAASKSNHIWMRWSSLLATIWVVTDKNGWWERPTTCEEKFDTYVHLFKRLLLIFSFL